MAISGKANFSSDEEVAENHSKLIDAIKQLDKSQRIKKPERNEPTTQISEFHLVKSAISDYDVIKVQDLARTLQKKTGHSKISKKIKASRNKVGILKKPLERPAADRIKRIVGYEHTKVELEKWNGIVASNRSAATLKFPLQQASLKLQDTNEFVKKFQLKSELEKKLDELDPPKDAENDKEDSFPLTLKEILEKKQQAAKLRAQESYKIAKGRRQNKIKSKKFHRIQRREKVRILMKEFEQLQKNDPEAALKKLEQLDKTRAEERMTLRHKSTGKWAHNKQIRAKYDKESRQVLAEQLSISRDLTQKIKKDDSEEDEEEEENQIELMKAYSANKDNPWVNSSKTRTEIDEFVTSYRKFWDEKNKAKQKIENKEVNITDSRKLIPVQEKEYSENSNNMSITDECKEGKNERKNVTRDLNINKKSKMNRKTENVKQVLKSGTSNWAVTEVNERLKTLTNFDFDDAFEKVENEMKKKVSKKFEKLKKTCENKKKKKKAEKIEPSTKLDKLSLKGQKEIRPIIDEPLAENILDSDKNTTENLENLKKILNNNKISEIKTKSDIDPNKYINVKPKHIKTILPDDIPGEAFDDSETEDQQHLISEAFEDDDVVDEFQKEKEEEIKKSQPKDIDLTLPGWGSWGGKNMKQRRSKRFILKAPASKKRRDENKSNVIIIEENNEKLKKHLVSELPYPFTSVKDFEASIRAPIGRNFVPENIHNKLIQPSIITKAGRVIEPMDEEVLINTNNMKRKLPSEEKTNKQSKTNKKSPRTFQNTKLKDKPLNLKKKKERLKSA